MKKINVSRNELFVKKRSLIVLTGALGGLLTVGSCKPQSSSEVKNIQALEAGKQTADIVQVCTTSSSEKLDLSSVNISFPDFKGAVPAEVIASTKDALQTSLLASPKVLRAMFLGSSNGVGGVKNGGMVRIYNGSASQIKDLGSSCKGDPASGEPTSCWGFDAVSQQPMLSIFANGTYDLDDKNIKPLLYSNIIVVLTMMYDQHFVKLMEIAIQESEKEDAAESKIQAEAIVERITKFKEFKAGLVDAFASELASSGREAVAKNLEQLKQNSEKFSGFVLAQLMDSYHCSEASKQEFKSKYEKTFEFFDGNIEGTGLKNK